MVVAFDIEEIRDESKMILDSLEEIFSLSTEEMIVGYNNLKFDVPFLTARLTVLGKMSRELHNKIYGVGKPRKWFDLYQFCGNDLRSLNHWLRHSGIKRKYPQHTGLKVSEIYYPRKQYRKIEEHNADDLEYLRRAIPET